MIPNFEIFGRTFSAYMILALIGYLTALFVTVEIAKRHRLDEVHMLYLLLYSAIGILLGGHILYGITNIPLAVKIVSNIDAIKTFKDFIDSVITLFGGSVFYGGLIGAVFTAYIYIKKNRLEMQEYFNTAILAVPLFHFFGRIGCFLSGCCYGIEWAGGIVYSHSAIEAANHILRFPVQLVEAAVNIILFIIMLTLYRRLKYKHLIAHIYFTVYPLCRFFLEFLRGDEYRGFLFNLSTSQIISVIILTANFIIFAKRKGTD